MVNIKNQLPFYDITTGKIVNGELYGKDASVCKKVDNVDLIFDSRGQFLGIRTCRGKIINGKFTCKKGIYDFKSFIELEGWKGGICLPIQQIKQEIMDNIVNIWKEK